MKLWAYEIDDFGNGTRVWEIWAYDSKGDSENFCPDILPENFGDFLDSARAFGYDVLINTYESWEALDNA